MQHTVHFKCTFKSHTTMIKLNDDTLLIGTTELRNEIPKLTKDLKVKTIIVMKRGKPIAVLEDFKQFEEKKNLLETFEDLVLGYLAKEREEKSKKNDYVSEEEVSKKIGVTL